MDVTKKKPEEEKAPQVPKGPGYQSQFQSQLDDIMGRIQNREKFNYDINGDALYNQYKDRYTQQGQLAMQDTMGQAAALTGGYGNSYAQNVGQQAYQGYMQGLNDKIPELYQLAMDKYNREGNAMMEQYGLLMDRDNRDYTRWQNAAALAQSQVNAMIAKGMRPSDDLIAQSGLTPEYIEAMMYVPPEPSGGGGDDSGSSGRRRNPGPGNMGSGYDNVKTLVENATKKGDQYKYIQDAYDRGQISAGGAKDLEKLVGNTPYTKKK